jgi:hypothetical protein
MTSWGRRYVLTLALRVYAHQAIHERKGKQFFLFSVNAMMEGMDGLVSFANS